MGRGAGGVGAGRVTGAAGTGRGRGVERCGAGAQARMVMSASDVNMGTLYPVVVYRLC